MINFIFKQDLEPVKVNSTTSRGMCREQKDNLFHFYTFLWHFDKIFNYAHRHYR